jgi:endonuclease YncB( thermonuclease family)
MDAPEFDQSCTDNDGKAYSCGHLAAVALKELIGGSPVSCASVDSDRYHRTVAVCKSADGNDLSNDMVRLGFAVDYYRYSHGRYETAEKEAREGRRGLWAGRFDDPASFRHKSHGH